MFLNMFIHFFNKIYSFTGRKKGLTYDEFMALLEQENDIDLLDDEEDQEYLPAEEDNINANPIISESESEEEAPEEVSKPAKRQKSKAPTVWKKKLLGSGNLEWSSPQDNPEIIVLPNPYNLFKEYIPDPGRNIYPTKCSSKV